MYKQFPVSNHCQYSSLTGLHCFLVNLGLNVIYFAALFYKDWKHVNMSKMSLAGSDEDISVVFQWRETCVPGETAHLSNQETACHPTCWCQKSNLGCIVERPELKPLHWLDILVNFTRKFCVSLKIWVCVNWLLKVSICLTDRKLHLLVDNWEVLLLTEYLIVTHKTWKLNSYASLTTTLQSLLLRVWQCVKMR